MVNETTSAMCSHTIESEDGGSCFSTPIDEVPTTPEADTRREEMNPVYDETTDQSLPTCKIDLCFDPESGGLQCFLQTVFRLSTENMGIDSSKILQWKLSEKPLLAQGAILDNLANRLVNDIENIPSRRLLKRAVDAPTLDTVLSVEKTHQIGEVLSKVSPSWARFVSTVLVWVLIATRFFKKTSDVGPLTDLIKTFCTIIGQDMIAWIRDNEGMENYQLDASELKVIKDLASVFLKNKFPLVLCIADTSSESVLSKTDALLSEVVDCYRKSNTERQIQVLDNGNLSVIMEELEFYAAVSPKHQPSLFLFVTPHGTKNAQARLMYQQLGQPDTLKKINLVPVRVFGVKQKMIPKALSQLGQKSFPKQKWKSCDVQEFVHEMTKHAGSELDETEISRVLSVNTDSQLDINVHIVSNKPGEKVDKETQKAIASKLKSLLDDPWTTSRQHFLHMYHVKNIHTEIHNESGQMTIHILPSELNFAEKISKSCKEGSLSATLRQHTKNPEDTFNFQTYVEEEKLASIKSFLDRTNNEDLITRLTDQKSAILGKTTYEMLEKKDTHDFYDFYSLMKNSSAVKPQDIVCNGQNVLHMAVALSRSDCFKSVFFLNLWDSLRIQVITAKENAQYAGYSPRGLAEKFLYKKNGPSTLEEYDRYENLWLTMPRLHRACLLGRFDCVQFLVERGANVHELDCSDAPCLFYACAVGSVEIAEFLIDHGADPKMMNDRGENCLTVAAMFGKSLVIQVLLNRCDFRREESGSTMNTNHNNNIKNTSNTNSYQLALDHVASNGDMETLAVFTDAGYPLDEKLMSLASKARRRTMVRTLVSQYDVPLHGRDTKGRTPLLNAVSNGDVRLLRFLLDTEEKMQGSHDETIMLDKDNENKNVLHIVAECGDEETCDILFDVIQKNNKLTVLVNERDFYSGKHQLTTIRGRDRGRKAYHVMRYKRTLTSSFNRKLTSGQIDVKDYGTIIKSGFGQNPSKEFLNEIEKDIEDNLSNRWMDMTPLAIAAYHDNDVVARKLLDAGALPTISDHFGNSPMHFAAMRGNLELAKQLEASGATTRAINDEGHSAADVAEQNDNINVVNFVRAQTLYSHVSDIANSLKHKRGELSEQTLGNLRSEGTDLRKHIIHTLREMIIDINGCLMGLDSGPVLEESVNQDVSKDRMSYIKHFAGLRPENAPFPSNVPTVDSCDRLEDALRSSSSNSGPSCQQEQESLRQKLAEMNVKGRPLFPQC